MLVVITVLIYFQYYSQSYGCPDRFCPDCDGTFKWKASLLSGLLYNPNEILPVIIVRQDLLYCKECQRREWTAPTYTHSDSSYYKAIFNPNKHFACPLYGKGPCEVWPVYQDSDGTILQVMLDCCVLPQTHLKIRCFNSIGDREAAARKLGKGVEYY